ncbi:MAG: hypothetical protein MUO82_07310 [Candidatus Thermoplasmatota archaeon]|nr:hypothetical protein [Candidatus Thermoplasmatota archaeon]
MRHICNRCAKVFQAEDITIHYTTGGNVFEIVAICKLCLDEYLKKTKFNTNRKDEDAERMKRKW